MSDVITVYHANDSYAWPVAEDRQENSNAVSISRVGQVTEELVHFGNLSCATHSALQQSEIQPRYGNADDVATQNLVWQEDWETLYHPGDVIITMVDGDYLASTLLSCTALNSDRLLLESWSWAFVGSFYRQTHKIYVRWPTKGPICKISALRSYPLSSDRTGISDTLTERGRIFWSCRQRRYVNYCPTATGIGPQNVR